MSIINYAKKELDIVGMTEDSPDEMNRAMRKHILHMVDEFAKEGHSGSSASYALSILEKVLNWKPLSPLTGEDSEWMDVSSYNFDSGYTAFQNIRCPEIFKNVYPDGREEAYTINGIVFWEWFSPDGETEASKCYFTNSDSKVIIEFPYTVVPPIYQERK